MKGDVFQSVSGLAAQLSVFEWGEFWEQVIPCWPDTSACQGRDVEWQQVGSTQGKDSLSAPQTLNPNP